MVRASSRLHPIHMVWIVLHLAAEFGNMFGIGDPVEPDRKFSKPLDNGTVLRHSSAAPCQFLLQIDWQLR